MAAEVRQADASGGNAVCATGPRQSVAGFQVAFAGAPIVGFVIGGVNHARAVGFKAIADSECGVIEILRGDPDILDRKTSLDDLVIMQFRCKRVQRDGKI